MNFYIVILDDPYQRVGDNKYPYGVWASSQVEALKAFHKYVNSTELSSGIRLMRDARILTPGDFQEFKPVIGEIQFISLV